MDWTKGDRMIKSIRYERLYNLGQYEHEKICVEIDVMENDKPEQILAKAKTFCDLNCSSQIDKYNRAKAVLADNENPHLQSELTECQRIVAEYDKSNEMPF
jgi:hypothetical protein